MKIYKKMLHTWKKLILQQAGAVLEKGRSETIQQEDFLHLEGQAQLAEKNKEYLERCRQRKTHSVQSIIKDLLGAARKEVIILFTLSFLALVASLLVPLYLTELLNAIELHNSGQTISLGAITFSACVLFFSLLLRSFLNAHTQLRDQHYHIVARQMIVNVILSKILDIGGEALDENHSGKVQHLVHGDSNHVASFSTTLFHFVLTLVQLFSFLFMLFSLMGAAVLAGVLCLLLVLVIQSKLMQVLSFKMHEINKFKDERISLTSELFRKIKLIRMSNLTGRFSKKVEQVRLREVRLLFECNVLYLFSQVLMLGAPLLMSMVAFSIYLWQGGELSTTKIFSVIALFTMIRNPMLGLSATFYQINGAVISIRRLRDFLNHKSEIVDLNDPSLSRGSIAVKDLSFSQKANTVLSGVSLEINPGELIALTGNTGSGKSTLLNLLAGYYGEFDGTVAHNGNLSHLQHYMWLANDTIRNNILFGKALEPERYRKILESCQLAVDVSRLPAGDQTIVGELGAKLSGGQQQRIALARAIYADPDILLLDNPLSALDPKVAELMVTEAILPLKSKTIIITTNDPLIVSQCDRCFEIKQGKVKEVEIAAGMKLKAAPPLNKEQESNGEGRDNVELFEEEAVQKGNVKWPLIKEIMSQTGYRGLLPVTFICLGLVEVFRLLSEYWLANQTVTESSSVQSTLATYGLLGGLGLLFVIISQILITTRTINLTRTSHENMFSRVLRAPMSFFENAPLGRIVNRFSGDIENCSGELLGNLSATITLGLALLTQIIFVCLQMPIFAVVIGIMFFLYWRLQTRYRYSSRNLERTLSVLRSPFYSNIAEFVRSSPALRLHNIEEYALGRAMNHLSVNQQGQYTKSVINGWLTLRQSMLSVFVTGIVIVLVVLSGSVVTGALAITYAVLASSTIAQFLNNLSVVEGDMNAGWRVAEYCRLEQEQMENTTPALIPETHQITFESMDFSYPLGEAPVLQDVSFRIKEGEKVGICGRTGSGKSSLVNILLRLYPIPSGRISIGGIHSNQINPEKQRELMSVITQTPLLYSGSIAENVDPYGKNEPEEITRVLNELGLGERVESFPEGLNTDISYTDFSAGEKQLIVVARTLMATTPIVLLDEAFSDLDASLMNRASEVLYRADAGFLVVSHHLEPLLYMDQVLVFDNGRLVEQGTPAELSGDSKSKFYELFRRQIELRRDVIGV